MDKAERLQLLKTLETASTVTKKARKVALAATKVALAASNRAAAAVLVALAANEDANDALFASVLANNKTAKAACEAATNPPHTLVHSSPAVSRRK